MRILLPLFLRRILLKIPEKRTTFMIGFPGRKIRDGVVVETHWTSSSIQDQDIAFLICKVKSCRASSWASTNNNGIVDFWFCQTFLASTSRTSLWLITLLIGCIKAQLLSSRLFLTPEVNMFAEIVILQEKVG